MKVSKLIVAGLVLMAVVVCWSMTVFADPSVWPNQRGEICVENLSTTNYSSRARIAVTKTVGNNYMVQGVTTEQAEENSQIETTLFAGNALLEGNTVQMHISGSGYVKDGSNPSNPINYEVHGFVGTVVLDLVETAEGDIKGWVKMVGFHCIGEGECEFSNDGAQQLKIVDCE